MAPAGFRRCAPAGATCCGGGPEPTRRSSTADRLLPRVLRGSRASARRPAGAPRRGPPRPRKVRGEDRVWPKRGEQPCGSFGLLLGDRIERDVALALKSPLHVPRGLAVPPENQPD